MAIAANKSDMYEYEEVLEEEGMAFATRPGKKRRRRHKASLQPPSRLSGAAFAQTRQRTGNQIKKRVLKEALRKEVLPSCF